MIFASRYSLALETRKRTPIPNEVCIDPATDGAAKLIADYRRDYPNALHRPVNACATFNCHGMTFAARRTWIESAAAVQGIIDDDEYRKLTLNEVLPGDIAVYRDASNGDVMHSGIVVEMRRLGLLIANGSPVTVPLILSKWGNLHEVVHKPDEVPYDGYRIEYYRVTQ